MTSNKPAGIKWHFSKKKISKLDSFCLFVWFSLFHSRICQSLETSPLPVKGWENWPLVGREGSLECHNFCDIGLAFIMSYPRTHDTHKSCRAFGSGAVTTYFNDRPGIEPRSPACEANALPLHNRGGLDSLDSLAWKRRTLKKKQENKIYQSIYGLSYVNWIWK